VPLPPGTAERRRSQVAGSRLVRGHDDSGKHWHAAERLAASAATFITLMIGDPERESMLTRSYERR
jgi:hypothetical protein